VGVRVSLTVAPVHKPGRVAVGVPFRPGHRLLSLQARRSDEGHLDPNRQRM